MTFESSSLDLFLLLSQLDGLKLTFKKNRRKRKKDAGLC